MRRRGHARDVDDAFARWKRHETNDSQRKSHARSVSRALVVIGVVIGVIGVMDVVAARRRRSDEDATRDDAASRAFCAMSDPLVCAHGGEVLIGEMGNTAEALRRARERGRKCVEIDVGRTRDGALMAMNARDVKAFTRGVAEDIGEVTLEEVEAWNAETEGAMRALTLGEALREVAGRGMAQITIDFKENAPLGRRGLAQAAVAIANETKCEECLFWGKDDETIREALALGARRVGYAVANFSSAVRAAGMEKIHNGRVKGARVIALQSEMLTTEVVRRARRLGLAVHVWTVNDVDRMRYVINHGVDGVLTDKPRELERVIAEFRTQCVDREGL